MEQLSLLLEQYPLWVPLVETLGLAIGLLLMMFFPAWWLGWHLATRRPTPLLKGIVWGGLWCALLVPARLVAEAVPPLLIDLLGARGTVLLVWGLWATPLAVFYGQRLFAVVAWVDREQRLLMGWGGQVAPWRVVRPLILPLFLWCFGISLLVVLVDFGVAERFTIDTLMVALAGYDHPLALWMLQFTGLLLMALLLLRSSWSQLWKVSPQQREKSLAPMGVGSYLMLLTATLFYIPLGMLLGSLYG